MLLPRASQKEGRPGIVLLESLVEEMGEQDLSPDNLDAPMCSRLSLDPAPGGVHPLSFLVAAHRRCLDEVRDARSDEVKESLKTVSKLIVRYAASLLGTPDMFGDSFGDSPQVLRDLLMDSSPASPGVGGSATTVPTKGFLLGVLNELHNEETLQEVVSPIFDAAIGALRQQLGQPAAIDEAKMAATRVLLSLFPHKPTAAAFCTRNDIFLPAPSNPPPVIMLFNPRTGPALEHNTALGMVTPRLRFLSPRFRFCSAFWSHAHPLICLLFPAQYLLPF